MTPIKIKCKDNFILAATLYKPKKPIAAIMIAPATGIKKEFYINFATFLANNNYGVITYDNRGIGGSVNGTSINQINASLINWGKLDMTAVLEELKKQFIDVEYHLIGNSAGGQLVGLMDNWANLSSIFNVSCSSGSLRNMKFPFKISAHFFMNVFIPVSNFLFNQTNSNWVGMGQPLPIKVANQWKKWCNGTGYVETDFGKEIQSHNFYSITIPSIWLYAEDDKIANKANVLDMVRVYKNSENSIVVLKPIKGPIGHMGFFKQKNAEHWALAIKWLSI